LEEVRLLIAREEHARAEKGESRTNKPASFILTGLEIEEEQYVVAHWIWSELTETTGRQCV
jgi:hypothetical protein